ncbi:MAG TPA: sigma-54 dependent transcriptional regulator [Gemmataceae bacterium]|nr:sigma-54 dependent transcriptional regulator [Gemmataceae bacterium]
MMSPDPFNTVLSALAQELQKHTPSLISLAERLTLAATHDVLVLLTGETGTGKTHLARLIHEFSPRKVHPLLVVPCGALSPNLLESEFFGHARGAFTGADRTKIGKLEAADSGTLLLDEIDALPVEAQASLLRVIETGAFEPVGSNETKFCQARIIAASNWDLEDAVAQGKFRQDLYYRLNVLAFFLPPLRERRQDIEALARAMVARFAAKFGKRLFVVSPEVLQALQIFPWPGNIRQLENVLQQAVLVCPGSELLFEHLPHPIRDRTARSLSTIPPGCVPTKETDLIEPETGKRILAKHLGASERAIIKQTLAATGNSRGRAASALGISRVTLYKKMKKYGLVDSPLR